jgi:SEC-C motif domain protein
VDEKKCPCGSGQSYLHCCRPYHKGKIAPTPVLLLRSRYSAYALNLPRYIIDTTHPDNPAYQCDFQRWEKQISEFSSSHRFEKVEILEQESKNEEASVRFIAHLRRGTENSSFIEKSRFVKKEGRWLYRDGTIEGRS